MHLKFYEKVRRTMCIKFFANNYQEYSTFSLVFMMHWSNRSDPIPPGIPGVK